MSRKIIFIALAAVIAVFGAFVWQHTGEANTSADSASSDFSDGLICNDQRVEDYQRIQVLAGRMTVSPDLRPGTAEEHRVIHENFDKLSFEQGRTYFVVAHKPTGELFQVECADETCTLDEVGEPYAQCQSMNYRSGDMSMDKCMYMAVRFDDQNFCLQQPEETQ